MVPRKHSEAGGGKADVPVVGVGQLGAHDLPDGRAQVDAHVEDGEGGVAPTILLGVQLPDHGRDVRLKESRADDDEEKAEKKRPLCRHGQAEMP
jgi:hypothetical protein